jgi:primosomal replication protein N
LNQLKLHARIEQIAAIRYTPAGVPVLELVLQHQSSLMEAGVTRVVQLGIKAVILGINAETLAKTKTDLECSFEFNGFLAPSRNGKGIVFHIQDFHRM